MNRVIKFRVYSTVTGIFDFATLKELTLSDNSRISSKMFDDDLSFDQFTGLQDVNGVDIYKGDIIAFGEDDIKNPRGGLYGEVGEVQFCEDSARFVVLLSQTYREVKLADHELFRDGHTSRVVIGNIHQNPELLA
jgi:uncharacterized phage protein (TIGR01671 family)